MDREQIIRMAREAGITINPPSWWEYTEHYHFAGFEQPFERFAALVAAAEREKVAQWMTRQGYATGHGDNIEDLLKELEWQIEDRIKNIIRAKTYVMQNDLAESVELDSP
jgi:hypothetical protein